MIGIVNGCRILTLYSKLDGQIFQWFHSIKQAFPFYLSLTNEQAEETIA